MDGPNVRQVLNEARMNRCLQIGVKIIEASVQNRAFTYRIVSAEPLEGKTYAELQRLSFSVGVNDELTDIPLLDMLVVFTFAVHQLEQLTQNQPRPGMDAKVTSKIKTEFSESEAFSILGQLKIETPNRSQQ